MELIDILQRLVIVIEIFFEWGENDDYSIFFSAYIGKCAVTLFFQLLLKTFDIRNIIKSVELEGYLQARTS